MKKIIEIKNCTIAEGSKIILNDFSLTADEFEHTAIIGPNGSGKSTFIRMLMRDLHPSQAFAKRPEVKVLGRDDWNIFEMRRAVSIISPKFAEQLLLAAPLGTVDAISSSFFGTYGFFADDRASKEQLDETQKIIKSLHLEKLKDSSIEELSTGELRKILIARAMVLKPKLVLLDEPTSGLDVLAQHDFLNYLKKITLQTTVLMVTHHLEEIIPNIKKILLIKNGEVFKFGKKEEILTEKNLSELFETEIALHVSEKNIYSMRKI